jgi:hypothetical protein
VRWTWRRSTVTANIITEGTQLCSPYNTSTPTNTTYVNVELFPALHTESLFSHRAKWAFVESPVLFNNGLWTPTWYVKFDQTGSFPYFSAYAPCRSRSEA